jgi:hypothetical protein
MRRPSIPFWYRYAITVAESYLFHSFGLALNEKQMPGFAGNFDSQKNWMKLLEPEAALRRHTIHSKHDSGSRSFNFGLCQSNFGPIQGRDK